jgi:hypothetical protein
MTDQEMIGMTGKKDTGATWHPTTVVLQSDIYRQALEKEIDISDACNRALAGLTGAEYHPEQRGEVPVPPPVIIAKDGASPRAGGEPKKGPMQKLHPVINAEDPAAPARVVQAKTPAGKVPAESPAPVPAPEPVSPEGKPVTASAAPAKKAADLKEKTAPAKKRSRTNALKTFFSSKIARTDDAGAAVGKDELYERFSRFCREHRITPVPERKAITSALKNQFALTEKLVNGTPSWTGIRLK